MSFDVRGRSAAALLVLVAICGCSSSKHPTSSNGSSAKGDGSSTSAPATKPSPTPTVDPGLSPASYRYGLSAAAGPLNAALALLVRPAPLGVVSARLHSAQLAAGTAAAAVGRLDPPRAVRVQHDALVTGLQGLSDGLSTVGTQTQSNDVCAASSAMSTLRQQSGVTSLIAAIRGLATAGYRAPFVIPTAPARSPWPGTGTFMKEGDRSGNGQLTVENGTDTDALVTLAVGTQAKFSVFVRHGATYIIKNIDDGTYTVFFAGGLAWDNSIQDFSLKCDHSKFDDPFAFTTTDNGSYTQYSTWSVTLYTIPGGNATTSDVPSGSFPR